MPESLQQLQRAAIEFVREHCPGQVPVRIIIKLAGSEDSLVLPLPVCAPIAPGPAAPLPAARETVLDRDEDDEGERAPSRRQRCATDIIRVIRRAGHNVTTTMILSLLAEEGIEVSERTVAGCLARMVEDGTLFNERARKPRGYGLSEWEGAES